MALSKKMLDFAERSSWIRKMFEEGAKMKAEFGAENIFDFSLGNPDVPPPPQFQKAMEEQRERARIRRFKLRDKSKKQEYRHDRGERQNKERHN